MSPHSLENRLALVTGGGSGIGRATCRLLARDGARVVVTDISLQDAQDTLNLLHNPDDHLALALDVREKSSVNTAINAVREKFGCAPSLLVNNAGIARDCPFLSVDDDMWEDIMQTNLKGTFLVTQAVTQALLEEPAESRRGAAVVNVASINGKTGFVNHSHYSASKGGVMSLTKTCAAELAKEDIRVNCVMPGYIKSRMSAALPQEAKERALSETPLGRGGEPEEVAEVVLFLLSPRSSYVVGACVEVTGGLRM